MKKTWVWIAILVVILVLAGYLGRHKIRSLMGTSSTSAPVTATNPSEVSPTVVVNSVALSTKTDAVKGVYLVDSRGMSLYVFDKDTAGVSNCNGTCATVWPAYGPNETPAAAVFTTIKRADGSMQYAYKGRPLYYYQPDTKAGDTLGDGIGGTWHLAKP